MAAYNWSNKVAPIARGFRARFLTGFGFVLMPMPTGAAASDPRQPYQSNDGQTWSTMGAFPWNTIVANARWSSMCYNTDNGILLAVEHTQNDHGFATSEDGGASWVSRAAAYASGGQYWEVERVPNLDVQIATQGGVVWGSTTGGFVHSTDPRGPATFRNTAWGSPFSSYVRVMYCAGLSKTVAINRDGGVATSTAAIATWSQVGSNTNVGLGSYVNQTSGVYDAAYSQQRNRIVAVGPSGIRYCNGDPTGAATWTSATIPASTPAHKPMSVCWDQFGGASATGKFVCGLDGSSGAKILTSDDGITWVEEVIPEAKPVVSLAAGSAKVIGTYGDVVTVLPTDDANYLTMVGAPPTTQVDVTGMDALTQFGTPAQTYYQDATGLYLPSTSEFGEPTGIRNTARRTTNVTQARGLMSTQFGRPTKG